MAPICMDKFGKSVKKHKDGAIINLFVTSGAQSIIFPAGFNKWRKCRRARVAPEQQAVGSMRIHIIAVAGTGMGALAGLLQELGHEVSGSDVAFHPPMGPALQAWGIRCLEGFAGEHLEPPPDLVVVGNKGMTGARRFLLGSVPNNISHHAPCSVLIVKTT